MAGRAPASIHRFFRFGFPCVTLPKRREFLGDTVASPPGLPFRVLRKPQAKGKTTMKLLTTSLREKLLANGRANRDTDGLPASAATSTISPS